MTVRALAGLFVLHLGFLAVGSAVLVALLGRRSWRPLVHLAGLGYLSGVATLGIVWTVVLAAGIPFGPVTMAASGAVVVAASLAVRPRRAPASLPARSASGTVSALAAAAGIGAAGVYLLALFRAARLQGVFSFDGWAFWVTRGKAVHYFDGFDQAVFASVPHPSYPPVIPILDGAAFDAMGSADVVTLHVQYWLLAVGFVAAVAGLLSRRVPGWILWPSLVLAVVVPRMRTRVLDAQADIPLDYLLAVAAVLLALWLVDREPWRLPAATLLLACGALVKREGLVLAACLLVAAALATLPSWRRAWPRLALVGLATAVATLPWSLWYRANGIEGEVGSGWLGTDAFRRAADSLRVAAEVLVSTERWSVVPTVALAAVLLAALWGRRAHATFTVVLAAAFTLASSSTSVVFPDIGITADEAVNPVVRLTAGTVLILSCLTPLLLAGVWRGAGRDET